MRKKILYLLIFSAIYSSVIAQTNAVNTYASLINEMSLKKHLAIIASDSMEGRETGTAGQRKAANYIEEAFRKSGLSHPQNMNGYQQYFPIQQDVVTETSLMIDGKKMIFGSDFISPVSMNNSNSFEGKEIVFAGYGIDDELYSDYTNIDVKGKVVVFFNGEPKKDDLFVITGKSKSSNWSRRGITKKLETAYLKGAIGALYINTNQETFSPQTILNSYRNIAFNTNHIEKEKKINVATISHALVQKILGTEFSSVIADAKSSLSLNNFSINKSIDISFGITKASTSDSASNVIAVIEGSDKKDEYVFLTAHYDHLGNQAGIIYNGADDDGSGTVTVLQMASAFAQAKKEGYGPKRTMVFMTVSGEEKGLWGSEYYSDHPVFPLENTSVDLNTDMIGRIDTERKKNDLNNYLYVVGKNKISSELPTIVKNVNQKYSHLVLDEAFDNPNDPNRIFYRSDHYNFARKGVPILFFYDGMLQGDYHKPTDDIENINWSIFEKRAKFIFHMAWEMANRDEMLIRDLPLDNN